MLHILWMLVKFILILLGIVLGLAVLVLLLVLFCPVRYRADAVKEKVPWKQASASLCVSWLFHGVWLKVFLQDGKLCPDLRILGIPLLKFLKKKQKKKIPVMLPETSGEAKEKQTELPQEETGQLKEEKEMVPEDSGKPEKGPGFFEKAGNKIHDILEKLEGIPGKIADKFRKISLTIQNIYAKIDWWKQLLTHERTKEALSFVKNKLIRLCRHIFPTRITGKVVFGSEDPSVTGSVLAVLGITMPFHKNRIEIVPVFDGTNLLEGNVHLKGRIYGIVLLKTAVEIYFNKNVKYVISRWKQKEG